MLLLVNLLCIGVMYRLSISKGMPVKRWLLLGGLIGPLAFLLFNIHYRRALLRHAGQGAIAWRP